MNNEKVTINYLLNEGGRKDSILKNQGGKEINLIKTEVTDRILKLARVNEDGSIDFHTYHYNGGGHWTEVVEEALS